MDWLVNQLIAFTGWESEPIRFFVSLVLAWFASLIYFLKKNEKIILREHFNLTEGQAHRRMVFECCVIFLGVVFSVAMIGPATAQSSLITGLLSEATVDHYVSKGADILTKKMDTQIGRELKP